MSLPARSQPVAAPAPRAPSLRVVAPPPRAGAPGAAAPAAPLAVAGHRGRIGPFRFVHLLWRSRWNLARLTIACFALWLLAADTGARLARLTLSALPDFDYLAEVRHLRESGRYGEALVVADAGLEATKGQRQVAILREKQRTLDERSSVLRRLKDVGIGALSGTAGEGGNASLERLGGAIAADLFVVGDVRDLILQGGHYVVDGQADELVLLLSTVGLVTTLAPEIDWVPSLLKIAKKAGKLTRGMEEYLKAAIKGRRVKELEAVMGDVKILAARSSPAGAVRLLAHADGPADVAKLARFMERNGRGASGAFAMHVTGGEGAAWVKDAAKAQSAGAEAAAGALKASDEVLISAAKKGAPGAAWLRTSKARVLLKPHPLIGLAKGVWKGNVQSAILRVLEEAGPMAWWLLPLCAAWAVVELGLLGRRFAARPA